MITDRANSPLVLRIMEALKGINPVGCVLHVSVANEPIWETAPNGKRHLIRWLCWSVNSNGVEVRKPEFAVLHDTITKELLAQELPALLPEVELLIDDDIEV